MQLWSGSLRQLRRDIDSRALGGRVLEAYYQHHRTTPGASELTSWELSPAALARALTPLEKTDLSIALEYHLPLSAKRIDAVLLGLDAESRPRGVVVELKQWSNADVSPDGSLNLIVGGDEHVHPSQQAQDYVGLLGQMHSSVVEGRLSLASCSFCHNAKDGAVAAMRDARFAGILDKSPLFAADDDAALLAFARAQLPTPNGKAAADALGAGRFLPSPKLLNVLEETIHQDRQWHLVDEQRVAYNTIFAAVDAAVSRRGKKAAFIVRGGPGTGKTVIAIQLLADAIRRKWTAIHVTGGVAFTTALKSKFKGADALFQGNMNLRTAATNALDLVLVDEAHRIRETSDTRFTAAADRNRRSQVHELLNAGKVVVFFIDENQSMRPDEIGSVAAIRAGAESMAPPVPLRAYDLSTQFRCGGCTEYSAWIDHALGFSTEPPGRAFGDKYALSIVDDPAALDELMRASKANNERARLVAGFCWEWGDRNDDGTLPLDVKIGAWQRPWNAKREKGKNYKPAQDPYTLWAEAEVGESQVGCIYSAQGFEFDRVGVIWGPDLVWRNGEWVAQRKESKDKPVKAKNADTQRLLRNAYRVLLTRGIKETRILCLDEQTRGHLRSLIR